jgi:hypothetical protein
LPAILVAVHLNGLHEASHVAHALDLPRLLACLVQCRKKNGDKKRNDSDYDQKFDQCKTAWLARP